MSILARPNVSRAELDEIIRESHLYGKVAKEILSKAMAVKGLVDPPALYADGVQPAGGGDAGSGRVGRQRRGVRFKGGQQQQQLPQWQPQQQQLKQRQMQPQQQQQQQ